MSKKDLSILVDGDIVVYRCAFAAEHTRYGLLHHSEDGMADLGIFDNAAEYKAFLKENGLEKEDVDVVPMQEVEDVSHALANVKSVMSRINEQGGKVTTYLSQGRCFRNDIATLKEYKGNRKDARKPVYYDQVREYLIKYHDAIVLENVEADDMLAIEQSDNTVIASIDKDLLQVPGKHYNWVKEEKVLIEPAIGLKKLYIQVLTGDSTDNIPGIPGVGPVKARKILDGCTTEEEMWEICIAEWDRALDNNADRILPEGWVYDDETEMFIYPHWETGEDVFARGADIALEVLKLVTVGGDDAKDEIKKSSG